MRSALVLIVLNMVSFNSFSTQDLQNASVLVLANKQDMKNSMSAAEISQSLTLSSLTARSWHVQACCALTGEGYVCFIGVHMFTTVFCLFNPVKPDILNSSEKKIFFSLSNQQFIEPLEKKIYKLVCVFLIFFKSSIVFDTSAFNCYYSI